MKTNFFNRLAGHEIIRWALYAVLYLVGACAFFYAVGVPVDWADFNLFSFIGGKLCACGIMYVCAKIYEHVSRFDTL